MSDTVLGTTSSLLRGVLDTVEDEEARFKVRTALQLLVVAEDEHERLAETLSEAELDDDLQDRLRDLGYVD